LEHVFKSRFGLTVVFDEPTVIYKETPSKTGEGFEAYTMPKPCWAIIKFLIEPLDVGSGFEYESKVGPDTIPMRYQSQIAQALPDALRQGPKGWEITDLRVTLIDGESHVYHTHPLDFITTTPMALLNGLAAIGTDLLEPYMVFELSVPEEMNVKILGEITRMSGRYDETYIQNGTFTVRGVYPLAKGLQFPVRVNVLTSGRGILQTQFSHYEKAPSGVHAAQPYRGVSPLDRAKYILHIRKAL
jgi:ribosomal protection tetracycline resistance protein